MFIDEARIFVKAGRGGNGCASFKKEKYLPKGGPDGGNGGRGGNVILKASERLRSLMDFYYRRHFSASDGGSGKNNNRRGKDGEDFILEVPLGTLVRDSQNNILCDLTEKGQEVIIVRGGQGGRGNASFTTSTRRAPSFAEKGEPGEEEWIKLELKLLADVGLIGFPNAGKSTLISKISKARPKIASYPFTTKAPYLGVVSTPDERNFVVADIPGLLRGAHQGAGLGQTFLKHIERSAIFLHLIDLSIPEGRDPISDFKIINEELKFYNAALTKRPQIVVGNKIDLPQARKVLSKVSWHIKERGYDFFPISALTGEGLDKLVLVLSQRVFQERSEKEKEEKRPKLEAIEYSPEEMTDFEIFPKGSSFFEVRGKYLERLVNMADLENEEAVAYLQRQFQKIKLEEKLLEAGAEKGGIIKIGSFEFDFYPEGKLK